MKHFVLMSDGLTLEEQSKLLVAIQARGMGWCHYLTNSWLLADGSDAQTADGLNVMMTALFPNKKVVILQVSPITWAVRLNKADLKANEEWMSIHWRTDVFGPSLRTKL